MLSLSQATPKQSPRQIENHYLSFDIFRNIRNTAFHDMTASTLHRQVHREVHRPGPDTLHTPTPLAVWNGAMEGCLQENRPEHVIRLAQVVLRQLPRHVPTYLRLMRALWDLRKWEESELWARRLLQIDPTNALAWRSLGRAAEQRNDRTQANLILRRAFECDPYEPEIRAGLRRTSLIGERTLELNLACLATLYLRGQRWQQAADSYRTLLQADPRRVDFQSGLLLALWQGRDPQESHTIAQQLRRAYPHLLLAWAVLDATGDDNDRALAHQPLVSMDPDGDYLRSWFTLPIDLRPVQIMVSEEEQVLLNKESNQESI